MHSHERKRIAAEQNLIEEILREIEQLARGEAHADLRPLGRQRRRLIETMPAHFHRLDTQVYPVLLQWCAPGDRAAIETVRAEGQEFASAYRLYLARWNAGALLADWENYRRSALGMITRARAIFARFDIEVSPLLDAMTFIARVA